ncbi:MAG: antitoxin VbhA family protein [Pseudonocardiaceae bacterium]
MNRRETLSIREAREQLPRILDRFRQGDREPVFVGAQRRTDGVVLPIDIYHDLLERRLEATQQAEASVRAEGVAPSAAARRITDQWARGALTSSGMREEIARLYGV